MTKIANYLENEALSSKQGFKQVYRIYEACEKHFKEASEEKKKAKKLHLAIKDNPTATKEEIREAKCARRAARNFKDMWKKMLKTTAHHLNAWVKLDDHYNKNQEKTMANSGPKEKKAEKKDKTSSPVPTKAANEVKQPVPSNTISGKKAPLKQESAEKVAPAKPVNKSPKTVISGNTTKQSAKDDLKKIEGIGPKIEVLLNADGIQTFHVLSTTPVGRLQSILDKAGPRYMLARPATWPQQAALAASAKWEDLAKLQAELKGGKQ